MCAKGIEKYVARHREDLTGEHSFGDAGQLILFILFMAVWITDAFIFKYSTLLNDYIPFYAVRLWLGIIILIVVGYMAWTGKKIVFGTVREIPHVIRQGIFGDEYRQYMKDIPMYFPRLFCRKKQ